MIANSEESTGSKSAKEEFHIDMSGVLKGSRTVGIACVNLMDKDDHVGCALNGEMLRRIRVMLFSKEQKIEKSKIYAICIFLLVSRIIDRVSILVVCWDEEFPYVKNNLITLLSEINRQNDFEIISIRDKRAILRNPNFNSIAHNAANHYREKAQKKWRRVRSKGLNYVEIDYKTIKWYFEKLKM